MSEGFVGVDINGISKTIRVGGRGSATDKHNFDLIQTEGFDVFISLSILKSFCFLFISTSFFIFKYFFMICFMSRSHGVVDFVSLYFLNALFIDF